MKKPVFELKNYIVRSSIDSFEQESNNSGLSLKYVLSGTERYQVDGEKHDLKEGHFLLVNKGQRIRCNIDSSKKVEGLCIYIDDDLVRKRFSEIDKTEEELLETIDHIDGLPVFRSLIYAEGSRKIGKSLGIIASTIDDYDDWGTGAFFYEIAEELVRHHLGEEEYVKRIKSVKQSTREEIHRRLTSVVNFIHASFQQDLSIATMAEIAAMSEFHFLRSFKSSLNTTPHKYVMHLRMQYTSELLSNTHMSIADICYSVGFHDPSSFTRLFKRYFGVTPKQFRIRKFATPHSLPHYQ